MFCANDYFQAFLQQQWSQKCIVLMLHIIENGSDIILKRFDYELFFFISKERERELLCCDVWTQPEIEIPKNNES